MPMFLSLRYSTFASFIVSTTFSIIEIPPQRDSAKSQLLRLYSQFSFTKILKALHAGLNIYSILEESPRALLKAFLIDVERLTLLRRFQDVIFEHIFSNIFLYRYFFNISSGKQSGPGHFLKSQGNFFLSFLCTLFLHIFDT